MSDTKIIKLDGVEYEVPTKFSYRQYHVLIGVFTKEIDVKSLQDEEGTVGVMDLLLKLHEKELIPTVLGAILKKKDDEKWDKKQLDDLDPFFDVDEDEAQEIIQDFLSGRGDLINSAAKHISFG